MEKRVAAAKGQSPQGQRSAAAKERRRPPWQIDVELYATNLEIVVAEKHVADLKHKLALTAAKLRQKRSEEGGGDEMSIAIEFANGKGGRMGGEQGSLRTPVWFRVRQPGSTRSPVDSGYNTLIHLWNMDTVPREGCGPSPEVLKERKPLKYVREVGEDLLILIKRHSSPACKEGPNYDAIMVYDGS